MNRVGYFSRLDYDNEQTYNDKVNQTTKPLNFVLDTNRIHNDNYCLSINGSGPRSSQMGYGVGIPIENKPAVSQAPELVNIESILTNRNMIRNKTTAYGANPIDVSTFAMANSRVCNNSLDSEASKLSYPPANYRDVGINRFYNLLRNPQEHIFYDFAENTHLTTIDNYHGDVHEYIDNTASLPSPVGTTSSIPITNCNRCK